MVSIGCTCDNILILFELTITATSLKVIAVISYD